MRATSSTGVTGHGATLVRRRDGRGRKQFRRVNGHMHLRSLRDTLTKVTETIGTTGHDEIVNAA